MSAGGLWYRCGWASARTTLFPQLHLPSQGHTNSYLLTVLSRIKDQAGLLSAGEGRVANKLHGALEVAWQSKQSMPGHSPLRSTSVPDVDLLDGLCDGIRRVWTWYEHGMCGISGV